MQLEGLGDEFGKAERADGPIGAAEDGKDVGEVGGGDEADGEQIGEAGEQDGPGLEAKERAEGSTPDEEEGFDEDGNKGVVGFEGDA